MSRFISFGLMGALALSGCGKTGTVQVFFEPEDTVFGLEAGAEEENIVDGWNIEYDKFLITVGNFQASSIDSEQKLSEPGFFVIDLINGIPAGGLIMAEFEEVDAVRFESVSYEVTPADASTAGLGDVAQADVDQMKAEGLSWLIQGRLVEAAAGTGQSCNPADRTQCVSVAEVPFEFKLQTATRWSQCEEQPGGNLGFAVAAGATTATKPTMHGDHWFFNNITIGSEETDRRAQHFADAAFAQVNAGKLNVLVDLNVLASIQAAELFPAEFYTLAGALIPVNNGEDYVVAQTHPSGHLNGEGECVPEVLQ
jgi:hypothetical protein